MQTIPNQKPNLSSLPNSALLLKLGDLVKTERKLTLEILHYLAEVEERRLFALEGFSSLFAFCTERLGYTESAAMRRMNAMRLLKKVPEIQEKVATGKLNLSQLSQVKQMQTVEAKQNRKQFTKEETLGLLAKLEGKSTRETDRLLTAQSPALEEKKRTEEKIKPVTEKLTSITLTADAELLQMIEQAKAMQANNRQMNPSMAELFKNALKLWISQKQKTRGDVARSSVEGFNVERISANPSRPEQTRAELTRSELTKPVQTSAEQSRVEPNRSERPWVAPACNSQTNNLQANSLQSNSLDLNDLDPNNLDSADWKFRKEAGVKRTGSSTSNTPKNLRQKFEQKVKSMGEGRDLIKRSRAIPVGIKRALFLRAQGQCEYRSLKNGNVRCQSKHALEIHHIIPFAKYGPNTIQNLEIRCRGHNEAQAVWDFSDL